MAEDRTIQWAGKSGKQYKYWITPIGGPMKSEPGNYVFVKESSPNTWSPLYIGETGNLSERFQNHEKLPCVRRNGGTHVCTHTSSSDEKVRKAQEADIINQWGQVC